MRRACEWHCYMNSAKPDPARILKQHDQDTKNPIVNDGHIGTKVIDLDSGLPLWQ